MGRLPTGLVVAAVAVLAVAAAVDSLRDASEAPRVAPPRAQSIPADSAAASDLRAAGATGTLVYSDEECRLHALRLPGLRPAPASGIQRCEPHVPTGGIGVFEGDVVWAGLGVGVVQVIISSEELSRALGRGGYEGEYRARQAVPLVGGRHAVLAEASPLRLLAFFEETRLQGVVESFLGEADSLRPSPSGRYVAVFQAGEPGIRVFSAQGKELGLPAVTNPHAIAWSPDERWTALATRGSIYVFATEDPDGRLIRIPVAARDLDWQGDEPPGTVDALHAEGLRGVLAYADEDCGVHAVALPDLGRHPASPERQCRLTGLVARRYGQPLGDAQRILVARCRSGRIEVSELRGPVLASARGCAPAWRPDGTLTAVRDGELVALFPSRVLLSREELADRLAVDAAVTEAAWFPGGALALVVSRPGAGSDMLAIFRGGRPVAPPVAFGADMSGLRISPRGNFVAARSSRGAIVLDREGRRVRLPVGVEALSWSPDEEWIAATRGGDIVLFPFGEPSAPGIRLALAARDVLWR